MGEQSVVWDGKDKNGIKVTPGIYFYKIVANGNFLSRKIILMDQY